MEFNGSLRTSKMQFNLAKRSAIVFGNKENICFSSTKANAALTMDTLPTVSALSIKN